MSRYWKDRAVSQRLSEARRARRQDDAEYEAFEAMMDQLPASVVNAIHACLNGEELLTLTPKDEWI